MTGEEKNGLIGKRRQTEERRRTKDRTFSSQKRNLSPEEEMMLEEVNGEETMKETCQECDVEIIKRVSGHCLTEVAP